MGDLRIDRSSLFGTLEIPSSKSHTLRAIVFGAMASGTSRIFRPLPSPDTDAMIRAVEQFGAKVERFPDRIEIQGVGGKPVTPENVIDCGNSGLVLRLIGALAGLTSGYTILTGDHSIRNNRPVEPLLDGLTQLGAFAQSSRQNGRAPILVKGPITQAKALIDGEDSQPVSALLIASAFAPHPVELRVVNPGEKPWIDMTLSWLRKMKIPFYAHNYAEYRMEGRSAIDRFDYAVPGDFSTAAFPIAAALVSESELTISNIDFDDVQGDKKVVEILKEMGARIEINPSKQTLTVLKSPRLKGMRIDVNDLIDALPILAVIGCFSSGRTELVNGAVARKKESDRIAAIAAELKKMGAKAQETPDGLIVDSTPLKGAAIDCHQDHRIAMSLAVAAIGAQGPSLLQNIECVGKTYPRFINDFLSIGANFELIPRGIEKLVFSQGGALETVHEPCVVAFMDYFGRFSTSAIWGAIYTVDIAPQMRIENRLKRTVKSTDIWFVDSLLDFLTGPGVPEDASSLGWGMSGSAREHDASEGKKYKAKPTPTETNFSVTRSIVLVGFKGVGKTHFGRLLSHSTGRRWIDTDEVICRQYQFRSIRSLFHTIGESEFRKAETEVIAKLQAEQNAIISVGGGAILDAANRKLLKQMGYVIYLKAQFATIAKRTALPPFATEQTYLERLPLYEQIADRIVEVEAQPEQEILKLLLEIAHGL